MMKGMDLSKVRRAVAVAAVFSTLLAGCKANSADTPDGAPLPTASVSGKMVCGFVSEQSIATALGTTDFSLQGTKQDLRGSAKNEDGSKLNTAGCSAYTKEAPLKALDVSVEQIGGVARWDNLVPSKLAEGGLDFVFPKEEGLGFATAGKPGEDAATSHLIVGDWHFFVSINPSVKGRNAVQDAVALIRQTVTQLGLPKIGKLPRPTATPAR
jgi:hypothetical protein